MPATTPLRNFQFLYVLNGRFDEPQANKLILGVISVVFAVAGPALLSWALVKEAIPLSDWHADQWTVALLIPVSVIIGFWVFVYIGGEYQFTGNSVILRRKGFIVGQIDLKEVVAADYSEDHHGYRWITIRSDHKKMVIMLFPELAEAAKRAGLEVGARQKN